MCCKINRDLLKVMSQCKNENGEFKSVISQHDAEIIFDLISCYNIPIPNLHIMIKGNKYIAGILGDNVKGNTVEFFKYNHFIESINDLAGKTKLSIEKCIDEYMKIDVKYYNPISNNLSLHEKNAYYYMENALFREIVLWDSLAQLYNIYFNLNLDVNKVSYKSVIKRLNGNNEIDFGSLISYIEETFDLSNQDINIGIHEYVNNLRNQMTHRYSIAITSFSANYNLRAMPDSIYRIAKDYNEVMKRLCEIIELILNKISNDDVVENILSLE